MPISRTQDFVPKILPAGRLRSAIAEAFQAVGLEPPTSFTVDRKLPDGSKSEGTATQDEVERICDLAEHGLGVRASAGASGPTTWHYLAVTGGEPGYASVHVQGPDGAASETLIDTFLAAARLEKYIEPPPKPKDATVSARPSSTRPVPASTPPLASEPGAIARLRAFLSYRFGKPDNDTAALFVSQLLSLADVEVITGRSYEPRPVGAKVADRLVGLDFLVMMVGLDGESAWMRDEIGAARANGVPVVPLVVDGAKFEPGLFGDLEYITFTEAHPGDAALSILEAVAYVRRSKSRRSAS